MSWVKVDDQAWSHPKFADLSGNAVRLWLFALCWANSHETDGDITKGGLRLLGGTPKDVRELIDAGLWHETEKGWAIHDFLKYQPSREQRNAQRDATAERVRKTRNARKPDDVTQHVTPLHQPNTGVSNEHVLLSRPGPARPGPSRPVPSRPVPSRSADPPNPPRGPTVCDSVRLTGLEQSLTVEPQARAVAMLEAWHTADFVEPHRWPEVHETQGAFASALGWTKPRFPTAATTRKAVELLAAYTVEELHRAAKAAPSDEWLNSPGKGPSCLTVEVVGRLLNAAGKPPPAPKGPPRTGEDIAHERRLEADRRRIHEMMGVAK